MRTARSAALATLLLAAAACSRSPAVQYHTLRPIEPAAAALERCAPALAVGVGPAEVARYLTRPELVRRESATQVTYDGAHRWAEGLESELLRVVGRNLTALLGSDRVIVYPSDAPFPLAYRVALDLEQLDAEPGGELVLRLRWFLRAAQDESPVAVERSEIRHEVTPASTSGLILAYSDALAEVSRKIAARLCELDAKAGASAPR